MGSGDTGEIRGSGPLLAELALQTAGERCRSPRSPGSMRCLQRGSHAGTTLKTGGGLFGPAFAKIKAKKLATQNS